VDRFIRRENVKHYKALLKSAPDEAERRRISKLLAEEQQKQKDAGDTLKNKSARSSLDGWEQPRNEVSGVQTLDTSPWTQDERVVGK
jgi:hypothetical protein